MNKIISSEDLSNKIQSLKNKKKRLFCAMEYLI